MSKPQHTQPSKFQDKDFLGVEPIGSLLAKLSIPAMIGMIVNALYNFVDTIFVGQGVGAMAIAGLSIAFPLQMIIGAFAQMYGVGAASIISRRLGEKNEPAAAAAAGTTLTATILTAIILTTLGLLFLDPILLVFGSTADILPYARQYLSIILIGAVFLSISMVSNNILRAEGKAKISMMIMIIGTGLNLIVDPVFICALNMGIRGAAIATIISQFCSALFALSFFIRGKSSLPLTLKSFIIRFSLLGEAAVLGFSTFVRQAGTSLMALAVNNMLKKYGGDFAIASYGMINRVAMFVLMPIFGIVQGFQPIAGYNYGAKNYDRVKQVIFKATAASTVLAVFGFSILELFPRAILSVFGGNVELLDIATPALRIIMLFIPLIGIQAIGASLFQSIGKSGPALFLGLSRQFLILIPLVLILPNFLGLSGVWISFPAADLLAAIITCIWMLIEMKKLTHLDSAIAKNLQKDC